jgi:hypothetical protein
VLRVWHQLRHEQVEYGRDRVARLMRQANLQGIETLPKKVRTTIADENNPVADNLLEGRLRGMLKLLTLLLLLIS